jgi:hypothetical protein
MRNMADDQMPYAGSTCCVLCMSGKCARREGQLMYDMDGTFCATRCQVIGDKMPDDSGPLTDPPCVC